MPIRTLDTETQHPLAPYLAGTVVRIAKEFTFDAAHFLPTVPITHKCNGVHGHTYRVELQLKGLVAANGFCVGVDYEALAAVWKETCFDVIDHKLLNDIPGLENPSTEVLAPWIFLRVYERLPDLFSVRVSESYSTWCEVVCYDLPPVCEAELLPEPRE